MEQDARVRTQRPVVVLAAAVDTLEWLFVQQYSEAVITCHLAHQSHDEHIVVYCKVAFLEDRSQLELVGSYLVVAGLDGDSEFQRFDFQLLHKGCHTRRDGAEVVVFELLVLGTIVSGQCAAGHQQVGAGGVKAFVNQEVFLFPAQVRHYFLYVRVEVAAYVYRRLVHCTQCFE